MIRIEEKPSEFVGGRTSLNITFPFDQKTVDIVKGCDGAYFSKRKHFWEVPINQLSYLLDSLTYVDDITFKPFKEEERKREEKPIVDYRTKPFPYQLEGIEYGLNHDKWLLLDQMGLGKTLQIIYLAEELHARGLIEHCLIICGIASLKTNWKKEIEKHSSLSCRILGERRTKSGKAYWATLRERADELRNPISEFFVITNIETLRTTSSSQKRNREKDEDGGDVVGAFLNSSNKFGLICLDEAHKCKNAASQQVAGLLQLTAPYQVAATGTPIMNNPEDLYVPLTWIGVNRCAYTNYKRTFCVMDANIKGRVIGSKNMDILKDELESCSLRRTKDILDLPPKTVINEWLDMEDRQSDFIREIEKGVKSEALTVDLKPNNLLAMATRIRQAIVCPSMLTTEDIPSIKIDRCVELVEQMVSNGDKVVVFSNYKTPLYRLQSLLSQYGPLMGTGDMKDSDISENIDRFQRDSESKVFLGTMSKMGTGVTLNRATYCIFLDSSWTKALNQQCEDRIHRVNNDHPVFIYYLWCNNSFDCCVKGIVDRKSAISDYIVDDFIGSNDAMDQLRRYIQNIL